MKKLLITGASGFLGYHLLRAARNYELYAIHHSNSVLFAGATNIQCDITNYIALGDVFEDVVPDAVIHAAAISDTNYCQQNKEQAYAVNVEATKNIAGICSDYNVPMAFTSTDLVFDGTQGRYKEQDEKNPLNAYGEQKSLAEDEVLKIYPQATVFRLPMMFGAAEASATNYLQKFTGQIKTGKTASLFYDEYRSTCGAKSIAEGILQLLFSETGIIHLAGKEKLSRYEFGLLAAEAFGLDERLLERCSQKDVKMAAPRPADVSLDITKALSLGFNPLTAKNELLQIAAGNYLP